ncbi:MAG: epoxyqueuosine reductase QueH [Eubacterium coprostanoligenes]|uniref:epoxyqueuosine reductase QueH n=1 Tax=Eubacterium coprostanoligenes TaxID=290054 RepID=UPI0023F34BE0|nr:epoxyqueuosine reductase QueH [Eubacterium coprostanoligenes]MDD6664828.1 epoxyqueuosine reductase QueH [Eubacterium coprostanoligenes]MDD7358579.1 epoxyqueuosine reductase QueH [Eubacterium coprostanoligenes]
MNKINYQKELDKITDSLNGDVPKLFLHSCCAPCSSYTLEYLSNYFDITVYYFNPNISPKAEFDKRYAEQKRLIEALPSKHTIKLVCGEYDYNDFLKIAKGYENVPEGGERCFRCYRMRLESTAKLAKEQGFDYFCTTLSISPLKNSQKINEIGYEVAEKYGIKWLPSDFKKKEGYKRSIELSREYQLYRQNFCGCVFSKENKDE